MKRYHKHFVYLLVSVSLFGLTRGIYYLSAVRFRDFFLALSNTLSSGIRTVTNLVPFSTMEVMIGVLAIIILMSVFQLLKKIYHGDFSGAGLILCKLCLIAAVLYFLFMLLMGVCYHNKTVQEQMGITVEKYSGQQLYDTTLYLAEKCNEYGKKLDQSNYSREFSDYGKAVSASYDILKKQLPFLKGVNARPKPVLTSILMCYTGIDGICFPFTAEANVNRKLPSFTLPNVMAHEIAHSCQVAREDEASFIGILACVESNDAFVTYSAYTSAFIYCYNALCSENADEASLIYRSLNDSVINDFKALRIFYDTYQGKIQEISNSINDNYLKAQGQSDGTKSYGKVTDLLIAWYVSGNFSQ